MLLVSCGGLENPNYSNPVAWHVSFGTRQPRVDLEVRTFLIPQQAERHDPSHGWEAQHDAGFGRLLLLVPDIGCAYLIWPRFGSFRSFDLAPLGVPMPTLGGFCEEAVEVGEGDVAGEVV